MAICIPNKSIIRKEIKNLLERVLNNKHGEKLYAQAPASCHLNSTDQEKNKVLIG